MSKFESSIKQIPYGQETVYAALSDLTNLERLKDKLPEDKITSLSFDADSISINMAPVGDVGMRIVEREEPKNIKFEATQSPLPFNFWIQLVPIDENSCKMRLTMKADINPFIKALVSKPLQEGIEKIADALAMIKYDER